MAIIRHDFLKWVTNERKNQVGIETIPHVTIRDLHYRIPSLEACDPDELFPKDLHDIIDRTLQTPPSLTREIFILSRYEHLPVKEIAERVNLTPKSVEYHITQSLKVLRVALKEYLPVFLLFIR